MQNIQKNTNNESCFLKPDTGMCKAAFTKYYYDNKSMQCKKFIWGGCGGTIPFHSKYECKKSCVAEDVSNMLKKLQQSYVVWQQHKKKHHDSYQYTKYFSSWVGFGEQTTITVKNNRIIGRQYLSWNDKQETTAQYSESSQQQLGKNKKGSSLATMNDLYDNCHHILTNKDPETNHLTLGFDEIGILKTCLYSPKNCADDCSQGVRIKKIILTNRN